MTSMIFKLTLQVCSFSLLLELNGVLEVSNLFSFYITEIIFIVTKLENVEIQKENKVLQSTSWNTSLAL